MNLSELQVIDDFSFKRPNLNKQPKKRTKFCQKLKNLQHKIFIWRQF